MVLYFVARPYILFFETWNMLYTRRYNIKYNIEINTRDYGILNSFFQREGLYFAAIYDNRIVQNTQGMQTDETEHLEYGIDINGVKNGLTFEYNYDAKRAQQQLMKVFPDEGLFPINKTTTVETSEALKSPRGERLLLSQWNDETEETEILESDLFNNIDWNLIRFQLDDDVFVKVNFHLKSRTTELEFKIEWLSPKVARKDAIERRLVEVPLELMALIQYKVERALVSMFNQEKVDDHIIDCRFESINHTSSECAPDIIQMVRDAKNDLKQEEE